MLASVLSSGGPRRCGECASATKIAQKRHFTAVYGMFLAMVFAGCTPTPSPRSERSDAAAPGSAPAPASGFPVDEPARPVLAWLDPDAIAAVYDRGDVWQGHRLDLEAMGRLVAAPPRVLQLLRDLQAFEAGLSVVVHDVGPGPDEWLRPEALAFFSPLGRAPYLVRGLRRPLAEVEPVLLAAGFTRDVIEGMPTFTPGLGGDPGAATPDGMAVGLAPAAAFPWRIVVVADDVIAAVSLRELGTGLGPVTAARDLPAGPLTKQLQQDFSDPQVLLEVLATGPMLSFDVDDDIDGFRLGVRRWDTRDLALEWVFAPLGPADAAIATLTARVPPFETERVRELYGRVRFVDESPVIRGEVRLAGPDLHSLTRTNE